MSKLQLTTEEISFWERVYLAFMTGTKDWTTTSPAECADLAIKERRDRRTENRL